MFFHRPPVEPPPEVISLLSVFGLSAKDFPWYDVPSINPPMTRLSQLQIRHNTVELLDILEREGFLGNKILTRSLRHLDTLTGCGHQCDTCLANAVLPSSMFSFDGILEAFRHRNFLRILNPDGIRIGSSGDILDHPYGPEIVQEVICGTTDLDTAKQNRSGKRYKIKVYTNYRPNLESQLAALISLARRTQDRIRLTISLPMNRNTTINDRWLIFAKDKTFSKIFKRNRWDGHYSSIVESIGIQDVRHATGAWNVGRVLGSKYQKQIGNMFWEGDRRLNYEQRGLVKTYLNPDALWLMIYATMKESATVRVFTPLTSENIEIFSLLPWHEDFHTPPNWPGGKGLVLSSEEAEILMKKAKYKRSKRLTYVK